MAVSLAAAQEAASLPGGAPLAGIAAQLNGDSAAIAGIADNWKQSAQSGQQHTAAVNDAVSQVAADWKGTAQQAFTGLMQRFAAASRKVQEPLLVGSNALTNASNTIEAAQTTVEGICERLISYANQVRSKVTTAKQAAAANTAIEQAASEAVSECQTAVKQANSALKQVSSTLSNALTQMGDGTFSSLPTPGTQGVSPTSTGSGPSLSGTPSGGAPVSGGGGGAGSGSGGSGSGGGGGGGTPAAPGQVDQWIKEAIQVLEKNGVPASDLNAQDIWIIIEHESGGNPGAINLTDSNAAAGHPSQGLMQTIPSTFDSYALPGYNGSITNPVDNIIAGVRYAIARYGSLGNVPGVVAVNNGQAYVGY